MSTQTLYNPMEFGTNPENTKDTESDYASADDTASVIRALPATEDEKWLEEQLERIAPNRFDTNVGEIPALVGLIFELKEERDTLRALTKK